MAKLRVWHNTQIGKCKSFYIPVESVADAQKVMTVLSMYDCFLYNQHIRGVYSSCCGLEMFDEESQEWEAWWVETADGEYYDDVDEYCNEVLSYQKSEFETLQTELRKQAGFE